MGLVGAVVGFGAGWGAATLFGTRHEINRLHRLREAERAEADKALAEAARNYTELSARVREDAQAFQSMGEVIRELFLATGPRAIGPLVLRLVEQFLRPEQCALFVARRAQGKLVLANGFGLGAHLAPGAEVAIGEGRVGYVAEYQATMGTRDFQLAPGEETAATQDVRRHLDQAGLRGLRIDVAAPIMEGLELIGVLTAGGVRARKGQEKRLLALVADLTAFALTHAGRLKASEESASLDGLTGLQSRGAFEVRLVRAFEQAQRESSSFSIVLLDIDHFAQYNRNSGHLRADEVLRQLGQILRGGVRQEDVVARFGGEEFAVLFPGAPKEVALRLADGLREAVESYPFRDRALQPAGAVTVSGGVATFPEDAAHAEALVHCAEEALEMAKAGGRNQVVAATPSFIG